MIDRLWNDQVEREIENSTGNPFPHGAGNAPHIRVKPGWPLKFTKSEVKMTKIQVNAEKMPAITLAEAKTLTHNDTLYHRVNRNADGSAQRWRVNGRVKIWKRSPDRVQVPVKYGLYSFDYIDENTLELVSLYNGEENYQSRN